jgi:hypothetical protein
MESSSRAAGLRSKISPSAEDHYDLPEAALPPINRANGLHNVPLVRDWAVKHQVHYTCITGFRVLRFRPLAERMDSKIGLALEEIYLL